MSHTSLLEPLESRQFFAATLAVDTSFGSGGATTFRFKTAPGDTAVSAIGLEAASDGSAYVLGRTGKTTQIRKLTADGQIDTTWFVKKSNLLLFPAQTGHTSAESKIAVDAADRLLVLNGTTLSRFTAAGALDTTFGTKGVVNLTDFTAGIDFSVDSTNKIYVTGQNAASTTMQVERFVSKGKLDKTFDGDGRLSIPTPSAQPSNTAAYGQKVRVLASGKVMVAGVMRLKRRNIGIEIARFGSDGKFDPIYGSSGAAKPGIVSVLNSSLVDIVADGTVSTRGVTSQDDSFPLSPYPQMTTVNGGPQSVDYYYNDSELEPSGNVLFLDERDLRRATALNPSIDPSSVGGLLLSGINAFAQTDIDDDSASLLVSAISSNGGGRVTVAKYLAATT